MKKDPTIFAFKMRHNNGAVPCIQAGVATVAICKPAVRKVAELGDYLVGIGARDLGLGRVIFAMRVTRIFGKEYYQNHYPREDCIYESDPNGNPVHRGPDWHHYYNNATKHRRNDVCKDWKRA